MVGDDSGSRSSITKKTIVRTLSQETKLPQPVVRDMVDRLFEVVTDCLVLNQRLELRNFGVFEVKKRAARLGRNPKTNQEVRIAPRYSVTFKPGKMMEERLQRMLEERDEPNSAESSTEDHQEG